MDSVNIFFYLFAYCHSLNHIHDQNFYLYLSIFCFIVSLPTQIFWVKYRIFFEFHSKAYFTNNINLFHSFVIYITYKMIHLFYASVILIDHQYHVTSVCRPVKAIHNQILWSCERWSFVKYCSSYINARTNISIIRKKDIFTNGEVFVFSKILKTTE